MHDGKKSVAQNVFYDALDIVKQRVPDKEPIEVFTQAVEHVTDRVQHIAAAVREQRKGSEIIMKSAEDIQLVSKESAVLAQQMSDVVATLVKQAELLRAETDRFKV